MNSKKEINKEDLSSNTRKMIWNLPEIVDLDINESTQNQLTGPSATDGGPAFTDYNS